MQYEHLPVNLEKSVQQFAHDHHLSVEQAVETLIKSGLSNSKLKAVQKLKTTKIPGLPSQPLSAEDAVVVDEALELVMQVRRERSERLFGT